jgi:hypothetical protein
MIPINLPVLFESRLAVTIANLNSGRKSACIQNLDQSVLFTDCQALLGAVNLETSSPHAILHAAVDRKTVSHMPGRLFNYWDAGAVPLGEPLGEERAERCCQINENPRF